MLESNFPGFDGMPSEAWENPPKRSNFQVRRPDTLQFTTVAGLSNVAGVGRHWLRRLVVKEVVDNALDEMDRLPGGYVRGSVTVRRDDDTYIVTDEGRGIPQDDLDKLRDWFSFGRAMVTGKFFRLPSRGVLGNGLRVLASAVFLSDQTITVESDGQRTELRPLKSGITVIVERTPVPHRRGTEITFTLDQTIFPCDPNDLMDAEAARPPYTGRPSPHWLDLDHLSETFTTITPVDTTVRQLIEERLDGCTGAKAGTLAAPFGKGRTCRSMTEPEIAELLKQMRASTHPVKPLKLGPIGRDAFGEKFDGYKVTGTDLAVPGRPPLTRVPVLIEAWAYVSSRREGVASLTIYCNRTAVVGNAEAIRGQGGIRLSEAGLSQYGAIVAVPGGECELIVAVTSPFIPTKSTGKAPDLSQLQPDIADALCRAFVQSRGLVLPDPAQPKRPKAEPPPKKPKPEPYQPSGPLALFLAEEAEQAGKEPRDLLVLSKGRDPFCEDQSIRRNAEWFAEQLDLLAPGKRIHARGMYYRCLSAGVVMPDGKRFVGISRNTKWIETACKYARYLGLIPFDRIIDERSAPPDRRDKDWQHDDASYLPLRRILGIRDARNDAGMILAVPALDRLLPTLGVAAGPTPRQPYRICFIGEKASLGEVLKPIVDDVYGELRLATGEVSDTAAYDILELALKDGRPLRVFYGVDFDPSGWQMVVSLSRKFQAHIAKARYLLAHPPEGGLSPELRAQLEQLANLDVRVIKVAVTMEQIRKYKLPGSPLKKKERRRDKWKERWQSEFQDIFGPDWGTDKEKEDEGGQVEIDALAALRPVEFEQIVRDAVAPYFDFAFERRYAKAMALPSRHRDWFLKRPAYRMAKAAIEKAHGLAAAVSALNAAITAAVEALSRVVESTAPKLPDVIVAPETEGDEPEAVFDSSDDFVTATGKLQRYKKYKNWQTGLPLVEGEEDEGDGYDENEEEDADEDDDD